MNDRDPEKDILLDHAANTLSEALSLLRTITPEGWERAYYYALMNRSDWHTADVARLEDARLLALRGGPRYRDSEYSRAY